MRRTFTKISCNCLPACTVQLLCNLGLTPLGLSRNTMTRDACDAAVDRPACRKEGWTGGAKCCLRLNSWKVACRRYVRGKGEFRCSQQLDHDIEDAPEGTTHRGAGLLEAGPLSIKKNAASSFLTVFFFALPRHASRMTGICVSSSREYWRNECSTGFRWDCSPQWWSHSSVGHLH